MLYVTWSPWHYSGQTWDPYDVCPPRRRSTRKCRTGLPLRGIPAFVRHPVRKFSHRPASARIPSPSRSKPSLWPARQSSSNSTTEPGNFPANSNSRVPHPNLAFFARLGWGFPKDKPRLQHQRSIALKGPGFSPAARAPNSNRLRSLRSCIRGRLSFSNLTEASPKERNEYSLESVSFPSFWCPHAKRKTVHAVDHLARRSRSRTNFARPHCFKRGDQPGKHRRRCDWNVVRAQYNLYLRR